MHPMPGHWKPATTTTWAHWAGRLRLWRLRWSARTSSKSLSAESAGSICAGKRGLGALRLPRLFFTGEDAVQPLRQSDLELLDDEVDVDLQRARRGAAIEYEFSAIRAVAGHQGQRQTPNVGVARRKAVLLPAITQV